MNITIVWAYPFFILLLILEFLASRISGRRDHKADDIVADIACGLGEQIVGIFSHAFVFVGYTLIFHRLAPYHLSETSWLTWTLGIIGVDFCYYLWHRFSHRTHIGWATHAPHHQSQDYNYAVALRQSWTSRFTMAPFFWPLALMGIPPIVMLVSEAIGLIYQFWIHTRLIKRLSLFEWIFNTPSHHRVHHGIEAKYANHNYGSIFIIWDRIFGTFRAEEEEPTYGTQRPFESLDPIWANLAHFVYIFRTMRAIDHWRGRLLLVLKPPEWRPDVLGGPIRTPVSTPMNQDQTWRHRMLAPGIHWYALTWTLVAIVVTCGLVLLSERLPTEWVVGLALGTMMSIWTISGLLRGYRIVHRIELLRLVGLALVASTWLFEFHPLLGCSTLASCLICAAWLWHQEAWFRV